MNPEITRRRFVQKTVLLSAGVGLDAQGYGPQARAAGTPVGAASVAGIPQGPIGKLRISRLMPGGNSPELEVAT